MTVRGGTRGRGDGGCTRTWRYGEGGERREGGSHSPYPEGFARKNLPGVIRAKARARQLKAFCYHEEYEGDEDVIYWDVDSEELTSSLRSVLLNNRGQHGVIYTVTPSCTSW
jgi:hypothetical protein